MKQPKIKPDEPLAVRAPHFLVCVFLLLVFGCTGRSCIAFGEELTVSDPLRLTTGFVAVALKQMHIKLNSLTSTSLFHSLVFSS